jgi:hypothetical protein
MGSMSGSIKPNSPEELQAIRIKGDELLSRLKIGDLLLDNYEATVMLLADLSWHQHALVMTVELKPELFKIVPQSTIIYVGSCKCEDCENRAPIDGGFQTFMWSSEGEERLFATQYPYTQLFLGCMAISPRAGEECDS